jgi:hypothetical protein
MIQFWREKVVYVAKHFRTSLAYSHSTSDFLNTMIMACYYLSFLNIVPSPSFPGMCM